MKKIVFLFLLCTLALQPLKASIYSLSPEKVKQIYLEKIHSIHQKSRSIHPKQFIIAKIFDTTGKPRMWACETRKDITAIKNLINFTQENDIKKIFWYCANKTAKNYQILEIYSPISMLNPLIIE